MPDYSFLDTWDWKYPHPQGNTLNDAAITAGPYYASVGDHETLIYSSNATDWTVGGMGDIPLNGIAFGYTISGPGVVVAVGMHGTIFSGTSFDDMVLRIVPTSNNLNKVIFDSGHFYAVGDNGTIVSSQDGIAWALESSGAGGNINDIASGRVGGTGRRIASVSNGLLVWAGDWVTYTIPGCSNIIGIAIGADKVAVISGNKIWVSTDLNSWTSYAMSPTLVTISYAENYFFASGAAGSILRSQNGSDWELCTTPPGNAEIRGFAFAGQYVAVGSNGAIYRSGDGMVWNWVSSDTTLVLESICNNTDRYIAIGRKGTILTLIDGSDWQRDDSHTTAALHACAYGAGKFVIAGDRVLLYSADGLHWTLDNTTATVRLYGVAYGKEEFVAVGEGGVAYYSENGIGWNQTMVPSSLRLFGITCFNDLFIAVGEGGVLLISRDGANWDYGDSGVTADLFAVAHSPDLCVAVGANGTVIYSLNGSEWTGNNTPVSIPLRSVCFAHGTFVIAADNGYMFWGNGKSRWQALVTNVSNDLTSVAADAYSFWIAGNGSAILRSGLVYPRIYVAPESYDFGNIPIGSSSGSDFTVENMDLGDLLVGSVILYGPDSSQFEIVSDCSNQTITFSNMGAIRVMFRPDSAGEKLAYIRIPSNDSATPIAVITLNGTGAETMPAITVTPASADFGNVVVGTASQPLLFTVGNEGDGGLVVSEIMLQEAIANEFRVQNDSCTGQTIPHGEYRTFEAVLAPVTSGAKQAAALIFSNAPGTPVVNIPLAGVGQTNPMISVSPPAKDFGDIPIGSSSLPQQFTVTNAGEVPLIIGLVGKGGSDSSSFKVQSDNCSGRTLNPGESAAFEVVFSPLTTGSKEAVVNIPSNDPAAPIRQVPVSGRGAAARLSVEPPGRDFGAVWVGSASTAQTFTVKNTGTADLILGAVLIIGDDASQYLKQNDHCSGRTFAPGGSGTFEVVFKPSSEGRKIAGILIPSNDPDTPVHLVPLFGEGIAVRDIVAEPPAKEYPPAIPGSTPRYETYTVVNRATAAITVGRVHIAALAPATPATPVAEPTPAAPAAPAAIEPASVATLAATPASAIIPVSAPAATAGAALSRGGDPAGQYFRADDAEQFRMRNDQVSGRTLQPKESATLEAAFIPEYPGTFRAEIIIPTDYAKQPELRIPLAGVAPVGPRVSVWPFTYDFGEIMAGGRSANAGFSISNIGSSGLFITDIIVTGRDFGMFRIVNKKIPADGLQPGNSATFEAVFAPSSEGCREATVQIYSNDIRVPVCRVWVYGRGWLSGPSAPHIPAQNP